MTPALQKVGRFTGLPVVGVRDEPLRGRHSRLWVLVLADGRALGLGGDRFVRDRVAVSRLLVAAGGREQSAMGAKRLWRALCDARNESRS